MRGTKPANSKRQGKRKQFIHDGRAGNGKRIVSGVIMRKTAITLFSGGGGADIGMMAAGYTPVAGVEYDSQIAAIANQNLGGHVRCLSILDANPADFPKCDLLHASPPCPNFSVAKTDAKESELDIAMARKVVEFIDVLKPRNFTLENVRGYRKSQSFKIITDALTRCGYKWRVCILDAADFGVPQNRIRLFVLASLNSLPAKPRPTHQKATNEQRGLFETRLPRWVGWYEAIEDLIPTLPESRFAEWQLKRLPKDVTIGLVSSIDCTLREPSQPATTVVAVGDGHSIPPRAFILDGKQNDNGESVTLRQGDAPCFSVVAQSGQRQAVRAFLINESSTLECREAQEPCASQVSSDRNLHQKAFIVEGSAAGEDNKFNMPVRSENEPVFTMRGKQNNPRAWLSSGRVVSMTPRALARFQSFPDWYELPNNNALACRIIGNAVPALMYQRILESIE